MAASAIITEVYREHLEHFEEPDDSIVYEDPGAPSGRPSRIDVFVWRASEDVDITTFSTMGMADVPMPGAGHRAELHFSVRRSMDQKAIGATSQFLANLAMHPFLTATSFDWWHKVRDPGAIPLFTTATSVLLHPKFVETGWDTINLGSGSLVKILNVVPITPDEYQIGPIAELADRWARASIDLFAPR